MCRGEPGRRPLRILGEGNRCSGQLRFDTTLGQLPGRDGAEHLLDQAGRRRGFTVRTGTTPRTEVHMRDSDAFSWYMERDPGLRSTIVAVAWFERPPDWRRFVDRSDQVTRLLPHFRHKVLDPPLRLATPRWTVDDDFDLDWHLRRERVGRGGGDAAVLEMARREAMTAFDPAHPLWQSTIVEGLPGGRAAAILKLHHALTDGVGGMQMAMLLFDRDEEGGGLGEVPEPEPEPEHFSGTRDLVVDAVTARLDQAGGVLRRGIRMAIPTMLGAARHPASTASRVVETAGSVWRTVAPISTTLSPIMTERHLTRHVGIVDVPLDRLRAAAKAADGTLNDAFLASVAAGLRHYHDKHGADVGELRVTLPISIRKEGDPIGGNRITLQRCTIPVGIDDHVERMRAIHARVDRLRAEPSLRLTNEIAAGLNLLPASYVGGILKHVDFVASNVPGPPFPIYLAGARMTAYHAFGPTIGTSVNLTLISYCGTCNIGVNIDTAAVPDHEVLVAALRQGFDDVLELAETG